MKTRVLRRFDSANAVYVYPVERWAEAEELTQMIRWETPFLLLSPRQKQPEPYTATVGDWIRCKTFPNREDADSFAARLADGLVSGSDEVVAEFGTSNEKGP